MRFAIKLFFLFLFATPCMAQVEKLAEYQDSLKKLAPIILKGESDEIKQEANERFLTLLKEALNLDPSLNFQFDSLITIARITSLDNKFRIFNWHLPLEDGTYKYFGYIQTNIKKNQNIYTLKDKSNETPSPETKILNHSNWFGSHYYKMVPLKKKKYVLLGWDGNDALTNRKIIEPFSFDNKGFPRFGDRLPDEKNKQQKRVIFTYAQDATMSLKYDENKKIILFDHLSPKEPQLKGQYQFYGPDFSFDAYEYVKGKWMYIKDFDARNERQQNKKHNAPE